MEKIGKVDILGQPYDIYETSEEGNPKMEDANAYVELYSKKIILNDDLMKNEDGRKVERLDLFKQKVIRHELIHAFLHEAGMSKYVYDEDLVDWLAFQIPKIYEASTQAFREIREQECDKALIEFW